MIPVILRNLEMNLLQLAQWRGWQHSDRVMIQDMSRQVGLLKEKHKKRKRLIGGGL